MSLIVKNSTLPISEKGLFTTITIKKGTLIIEYKGELIDWKEYEKRVLAGKDGYLFYISKKHCIDAFSTPNHKARFANDAKGLIKIKGLTNNAIYKVIDKRCYIVAIRTINVGEEIFVSYSKEYWDCVKYNIKHNF